MWDRNGSRIRKHGIRDSGRANRRRLPPPTQTRTPEAEGVDMSRDDSFPSTLMNSSTNSRASQPWTGRTGPFTVPFTGPLGTTLLRSRVKLTPFVHRILRDHGWSGGSKLRQAAVGIQDSGTLRESHTPCLTWASVILLLGAQQTDPFRPRLDLLHQH